MSEVEAYVGRIERIHDEDTLARFVESPWSDPRLVVERPDLAAHLGGAGDRGRYLLGRRAVASMVVLPQLTRELGEVGITAASNPEGDLHRGASS